MNPANFGRSSSCSPRSTHAEAWESKAIKCYPQDAVDELLDEVARLEALAPDLLDALKAAEPIVRAAAALQDRGAHQALSVIESAISKAEGR